MGEGGQRYRFPALKWLSLADVVYGTVTVVNIVVRCVILHCILKRGGGALADIENSHCEEKSL